MNSEVIVTPVPQPDPIPPTKEVVITMTEQEAANVRAFLGAQPTRARVRNLHIRPQLSVNLGYPRPGEDQEVADDVTELLSSLNRAFLR